MGVIAQRFQHDESGQPLTIPVFVAVRLDVLLDWLIEAVRMINDGTLPYVTQVTAKVCPPMLVLVSLVPEGRLAADVEIEIRLALSERDTAPDIQGQAKRLQAEQEAWSPARRAAYVGLTPEQVARSM